ncbi:hypothetical protein PGUG_02730 [Meyerozyma guilliermondii ATCC 6260]|uniref:3-methyl-2-oxobutanoate hydroxymethyltransferase n=1 Tax=Meyerozyma guilliermondii (strain ATCC 6260 / CBS 566 / DSM 6381 / JCM 1539 / NBRC 10279 / NRRL Y-324) TaxID=294746 RepID=A5DHH9_PICGU|nr:uncharacterized protein PGUG_02730 [Meyerozyma guilliermondii ATCC 6260]EDK38632.1 hypothetical protein PGUG_02730 [Meyerozyma guilliermondii ATCC 6260]
MISYRKAATWVGKIRHFSTFSTLRSAHGHNTRKTLADIKQLYETKQPIAMVTAYDYISAQVCEAANADITLVGDSLAMVALGYNDTNEIPYEEFLYHIKAVNRGNNTAMVVADVPFGSSELSTEQAIATSIDMVKRGGVQGVKIEGGRNVAAKIKSVVDIGIPVMGHVGLTPQKYHALGGYKLQGNSTESSWSIYEDCLALQEAGAFSIVLECMPNKLAELITEKLSIPTIGIGAGPKCSGQVLVYADMLGMLSPDHKKAKFVKSYGNIYDQSVDSVKQYIAEVKDSSFPNPDEHGYKIKSEVLKALRTRAG